MKLLFLDEAVFSFNTFNTNALSPIYKSLIVKEAKLRIKAQAFIAAISEDQGLESFMIHTRSISSQQFIQFLEQLSRKFNGEDISVFMDNLSVHKTRQVMAVYKRLNITPIFNMPYSPEFNGIESYFSLVKA
jgi:transposase